MRNFTYKLAISLLTFIIGITAASFYYFYRSKASVTEARPAPTPSANLEQTKPPVPDGWQKIDTEERFTLYLPPNMKPGNVIGIESYFRSYSNSQMRVSFDFEPFDFLSYDARRPDEAKAYQEETVEISGRKATLISYHLDEKKGRSYVIGLFVGDWANARVKLVMWVTSKNPDTIETAKRIFSTVEIP